MAGADADAIPGWIEEGRRRSANARRPPFSGGLSSLAPREREAVQAHDRRRLRAAGRAHEGIATLSQRPGLLPGGRRIAGCQLTRTAGLVRVLYAELDPAGDHLDVAVKLVDTAGLAVATRAVRAVHGNVPRLASKMSGSRFGWGAVVPGGVSPLPRIGPAQILAEPALHVGCARLSVKRLRACGPPHAVGYDGSDDRMITVLQFRNERGADAV
jgi:hypothetical protein